MASGIACGIRSISIAGLPRGPRCSVNGSTSMTMAMIIIVADSRTVRRSAR